MMVSEVLVLQESQVGLVVLAILIPKSLSLVGSKLFIMSQRKEMRSEGRPGVVARAQILDQLLSGYLTSILLGLKTLPLYHQAFE